MGSRDALATSWLRRPLGGELRDRSVLERNTYPEKLVFAVPGLLAVQKFAVLGSRIQTAVLLSTQSAAASNARATDRACLVVRYSSWSADSHTPMSPFSFCTAATSAEKPSSPRRGGQCGPKCLDGPISPSGCSVWHQLGQVVEVMPSVCSNPKDARESGDHAPGSRTVSYTHLTLPTKRIV